jgi:hypothetical protein
MGAHPVLAQPFEISLQFRVRRKGSHSRYKMSKGNSRSFLFDLKRPQEAKDSNLLNDATRVVPLERQTRLEMYRKHHQRDRPIAEIRRDLQAIACFAISADSCIIADLRFFSSRRCFET